MKEIGRQTKMRKPDRTLRETERGWGERERERERERKREGEDEGDRQTNENEKTRQNIERD